MNRNGWVLQASTAHIHKNAMSYPSIYVHVLRCIVMKKKDQLLLGMSISECTQRNRAHTHANFEHVLKQKPGPFLKIFTFFTTAIQLNVPFNTFFQTLNMCCAVFFFMIDRYVCKRISIQTWEKMNWIFCCVSSNFILKTVSNPSQAIS